MCKKIIPLLLVIVAACQSSERLITPHITQNPEEVQLITSDIDTFWTMYDAEAPLLTEQELLLQYISRGTPALKAFYDEKVRDPRNYLELVNSWNGQQFLEDVRKVTLNLKFQEEIIIDAFKEIKEIYPQAIFTDINLVIGALNTGGVVLPDGHIVIGAEMFAKHPHTRIENLGDWHQSVINTPEYLPVVAIHELIHLQQQQFAAKNNLSTGGNTLLDRALLEGGADFITHLVLDNFLNDRLVSYADAREEKLWNEFQGKMNQRNFSNWLYQGSASTNRPADLGYYIGFKIVEAYYQKSVDKRKAVKHIIEIKDGQEFLKHSGYGASFK